MNNILEKTARDYLKDGLAKCTEGQQILFKRMYSYRMEKGREIPNLDKDINRVVDEMPPEKLDWAMQQVERTLERTHAKAGAE